MTLFPAGPLMRAVKVILLAAALAPGGFTAVAAHDGERGPTSFRGVSVPAWKHHRPERRDWRERRRDERAHRHHRHERKGGNFYGGAIGAWRDPGNGIYFYLDGNDGPRPVASREGGRGKVIHVLPGNDGCSWEAGVCVVRP